MLSSKPVAGAVGHYQNGYMSSRLRSSTAGSLQVVAWMLGFAISVAPADPAGATFPGRNGPIAFSWQRHAIDDTGANETHEYAIRLRSRSGTRDLLVSSGLVHAPAWSPDGSKIAFSACGSRPDDSDCNIQLMEPDGTNVEALTPVEDGVDHFDPTWSANGLRVVYVSCPEEHRDCVLVARHVASGREKVLFEHMFDPAWHPTRARILVVRVVGGYPRISLLLRKDGVWVHRRLTPAAPEKEVWFQDPSWHPGGRKIVFTKVGMGRRPGLFTMRPDGSHVRRVLVRTNSAPEDGVFSPNGRKLAFSEADEDSCFLRVRDVSSLATMAVFGYSSECSSDPDWRPRPAATD